MRRGGRYLIIGASEPKPVELRASYINLRQLTIAGTVSGDISHYHQAMTFLDDHRSRFSLEGLLSSRSNFDGVNLDLAGMEELREIKPVISPALTSN